MQVDQEFSASQNLTVKLSKWDSAQDDVIAEMAADMVDDLYQVVKEHSDPNERVTVTIDVSVCRATR